MYVVRGIVTMSMMAFTLAVAGHAEELSQPDADTMKKYDDWKTESEIPAKVIRKIPLPKGYREGLFLDGAGNIWINNGEKGKTWIVSVSSGEITSRIEPVGTFTEGITAAPGGKYWVTDWDTGKIYLVRVENNRMVPEEEKSFAPARPTGVVWTGEKLYVLTWTRGMGTEYHLIAMDKGYNVKRKFKINGVSEPSQLAWDGKDLWISGWHSRRVYRVSADTLQVTGHFKLPVDDLTGIVSDGKRMWVTGTYSDLYEVELGNQ